MKLTLKLHLSVHWHFSTKLAIINHNIWRHLNYNTNFKHHNATQSKEHADALVYFITGSDLLSAITATFEEKMRSLQESPLGLVTSDSSDSNSNQDSSPEDVHQLPEQPGRGNSGCRLYRDPSLHRRRTSPRTSVTTPAASTASSHISQVCWISLFSYLDIYVCICIYCK